MTTLLCSSPCCALPGLHLAEPDEGHDDTCRGCQPAQAADGLYLCHHCTRRIGRDALTAAQLHNDLGQVLAGGGGGEPGPRGGSVGVELHPAAVEARAAIRATLAGLCRLVAEERGIGLPADEVVAMARYVGLHAQWLAAHGAAGEHAAELRDVATDGRTWRVAYAVSGDRTLIGVCNQPRPAASDDVEGAGDVCGAPLWWRDARTDDEQRRGVEPVLDCGTCGASGTVRWWRWELCDAVEQLGVVDAYQAAAYLSWLWLRQVQPGTIWQWGRRYDDAGMVRELLNVTPLGAVEREWVEGKPLKDRQGRVLFVLDMLERRAERMWGEAPKALEKVGG